MTLKMAEGAVAALVTYLGTNFAAKVAALNTEYGDTLLTMPASFNTTEILEAEAFPVIEVLCDRTRIHAIGGGYIGTTHPITIICTVMDDSDSGEEKANLRKQVYRYARAIIELLRTAETAGGFTDGAGATYQIRWPQELIDFAGATRRKGSSQVVAACGVRVEIQVQEAG
jgi:hypothetical protein